MRIAVLQSSNIGFFPSFYQNLKQATEKNAENTIQLFLPNTGRNKRSKAIGQILFGTRFNWHVHYHLLKITGKQDCWSFLSTLDLIKKLKNFNPDILHLNVINECHLNLPMFVNYINRHRIKVVWTFHDCRCFTGGCSYFDEVDCQNWRNGCSHCPILNTKTKWQWNYRKKWITAIKSLQIVTPSDWLRCYVSQSFLSQKQCVTIHNGIDIDVFRHPYSADVRKSYGLNGKKIVLGCAINWEKRKGLQFFEAINEQLSKEYQIVLVGNIDKKTKERLNNLGILAVGRTQTKEELITWYQEAMVFVNPTLADNFPTTNIEALASGTPVISFMTGGSCESFDCNSGIAIEQNDVNGLVSAIIEITNNPEKWYRENCISRAKQFSLSQYDKYVDLYSNNSLP